VSFDTRALDEMLALIQKWQAAAALSTLTHDALPVQSCSLVVADAAGVRYVITIVRVDPTP